jgi:hypothetical protein
MGKKHPQITEAMQFTGAMLQIESEIMELGHLRHDRGGEERRLGHREGGAGDDGPGRYDDGDRQVLTGHFSTETNPMAARPLVSGRAS